MKPDALVPVAGMVQPTPVYELLFAVVLGWVLWRLGRRALPVGWLTGLYLACSGIGRFLVEFVRVNPKLYWGMSNAQVAALGTVILGLLLMAWTGSRKQSGLVHEDAVAQADFEKPRAPVSDPAS